MFSSRSFIVSNFTFRSLIMVQFISVYHVINFFKFPSFTCTCSVVPTLLTEETFFSIVYSCFLCCRLNIHKCVDLFLDSLFFSIDLYVNAITILFWLLYVCSVLWSQRAWYFSSVLFVKIVLFIHSLLNFHTNFWLILDLWKMPLIFWQIRLMFLIPINAWKNGQSGTW